MIRFVRLVIFGMVTASSVRACVIEGRVVEDNNRNNGIASVSITVKRGDKAVAKMTSGKEGKYCIENVSPGQVDLAFGLLGYTPSPGETKNVTVPFHNAQGLTLVLMKVPHTAEEINRTVDHLLSRAKETKVPDEIWMADIYRDLPAATKVQIAREAQKREEFSRLGPSKLFSALATADPVSLELIDINLKLAILDKQPIPEGTPSIPSELYYYSIASHITRMQPTPTKTDLVRTDAVPVHFDLQHVLDLSKGTAAANMVVLGSVAQATGN